jgi:hypothetical protein
MSLMNSYWSGPRIRDSVDKTLIGFDLDGDGRVDRTALPCGYLDRFDADGDGDVDLYDFAVNERELSK